MGEVAIQEPEPLSRALTPSGVEIRYFAEPKRKYEIRDSRQFAEKRYEAKSGPWREVPSVTTVLDVLDKKALVWWGMVVGVQGVHKLWDLERGATEHALNAFGPEVTPLIDRLTEHKLTVNHVRDKAGQRGISVHDALENWATIGQEPIPMKFPEEERGYVEGLVKFLADVQPIAVDSEVMVGSLEHGFAGRYDLRFKVEKECKVVYKHTPKKGDHYAVLQPGLYLGDLKTSKGVYPSHSRQLEAYEGASVECGYPPTVARGILHVSAEGFYEFVRSTAEYDDFLTVLEVWKSDQRMKARKK